MTVAKILDQLYYWFFILHIPITIFIDSGIVTPQKHQLQITRTLSSFHVTQNKDFLADEPPLWLQTFVVIELIAQLPYFFIGAYQLRSDDKRRYPFMLLYGFNATLTTLICIVYIISSYDTHGLVDYEAYKLAAVYSPYLLIPLGILVDYTLRTITFITQKEKVL